MLIYLLLIAIVFCSMFFKIDKNMKNKKIWTIVIFVVMTIISSCRGIHVGVDTIQYYDAFNKISHLNFNQSSVLRYEIGFFYLTKILTLISKKPQILFIVTSCIIIPSVGRFIYKYSKNVAFSTLIYILFNIFFFHMTGMRQSLALAILLFAYDDLKNNNYLRFVITVLIASLFHSSAIIFLICPLIKKLNYKKSTYLYVIIISILFFVFFKPIFMNVARLIGKYGGYIDSKDFGVSNFFGSFFQFLLTFVVYTFGHFMYFKQKKSIKINDNNDEKLNLMLLGLDVICQFMAMKMNIIGRMNQYFWIYSTILIPNIVYTEKRAKYRLLLYFGIIFFAFVYWLIIAIYRPEWNGAIPYIPFWKSYDR